MIVKLNESALFAMGFDRAAVEALRHLLRQIGAVAGATTLPDAVADQEILKLESAFGSSPSQKQDISNKFNSQEMPDYAALNELAKQVAQLQQQLAAACAISAEVNELRKAVKSLETESVMPPFSLNVDWTRPGKIGASTPNTGSFSGLTASGAVALSPANANVVLSPAGTGLVTISPATAGAMDNMAIGGTTKAPGGFTTVATTDNISVTRAAGVPKITMTATTGTNETYLQFINTGGGYYFGVENSAGGWFGATAYAGVVLVPGGKVLQQIVGGTIRTTTSGTGFDVTGSTAISGGFGCNGKTAQGAYALGAASTDLASVITLANNLRTMAIDNGIGS